MYRLVMQIAMAAIALNLVILLVAIVLAAIAIFLLKTQGLEEINKAATIFPASLDSINYSEIPIAIIAVIADYMQIPLAEVKAEYEKDATQRKLLVLQAFRDDPVTRHFIEHFPSKFINHGYVGEELLTRKQASS
uniref:FtsX_ECD domain-containing protein n=1 Tax=Ascaris lumbricoides TaxID=6252 RepID=A0A0M3HX12_ASCLU